MSFFFFNFLKIDLTIGITSTVPVYKPTVLATVSTLTVNLVFKSNDPQK